MFFKSRSTADKICRLTQDIKQAFHHRQVVGSVFLNLKAAYDTLWLKGLNLKLSKLLHCNTMINPITNLLYCRSFIPHTNYERSSRPHNLKNGVAQGSVLAPPCAMFTLTTSPIPYLPNIYADDAALTFSAPTFSQSEKI